MSDIIRVQKGGVVPIRVPFRRVSLDSETNGLPVPPVSCVFDVLNPDRSTQTSNGTGEAESSGTFLFYWDTSALTVGDYTLVLKFGYAFSSAIGGASKTGHRGVILRLVNAL